MFEKEIMPLIWYRYDFERYFVKSNMEYTYRNELNLLRLGHHIFCVWQNSISGKIYVAEIRKKLSMFLTTWDL